MLLCCLLWPVMKGKSKNIFEQKSTFCLISIQQYISLNIPGFDILFSDAHIHRVCAHVLEAKHLQRICVRYIYHTVLLSYYQLFHLDFLVYFLAYPLLYIGKLVAMLC